MKNMVVIKGEPVVEVEHSRCESCKQVNPRTNDGYTTCCNELPEFKGMDY